MTRHTYCPYCNSIIELRGIDYAILTSKGWKYIISCECGGSGTAMMKDNVMSWERDLELDDELQTIISQDESKINEILRLKL